MSRLFWLLFLLAAGGFLAMNVMELFPDTRKRRDDFRELVARGVPTEARVVSKHQEWVDLGWWLDADERRYLVRTVEFDYRYGGRAYRGSLRHYRAESEFHPEIDWTALKEGKTISIRVDPDHPERNFSPSFLEFGPSSGPPVLDFWLYRVMVVLCLPLFGAALYRLVLKPQAPPNASPG
jgi:hypothetical protein